MKEISHAKRARSITALMVLFSLLLATPLVAQKHAKSQGLTEEQRIVHVLSRLGFGARPGDVERVKAMGLENYINQQLNPEKVPDSVAENKVKELEVLSMTTAELYEKYPQPGQLLRRLEARRKLPSDLAEARENRVKGESNVPPAQAPAEMQKNDSMEMRPDASAPNNPQRPAGNPLENEQYRKLLEEYY